MIFLVPSGKMAFLFLENMIIFLDEKWRIFCLEKIIFLKKYTEIWQIFPAPLKKVMLILEKM